jgi:phosphatidylglycerophosphatase C
LTPSINSEERTTVAAFDFDITITTRDTFVPFLILAFGKWPTFRAFVKLSFEALLVLIKFSSRDRFKEKIVRELFLGRSVERLTKVGHIHAARVRQLLRPMALERIKWHKNQGHRLVMVSASLDLYLAPIALELGFDDLLCTCLSKNDGVFDGRLDGNNCRGKEKVERLKILFGDLSAIQLHAYGDSAGDKEMLELATAPYWRPFETSGQFARPASANH